MNSLFEKETVIIIDWLELPEDLKNDVTEWHGFQNDIYLKFWDEMAPTISPDYGNTWADTLKEEKFREYYKDQKETNNYTGTFEEFINDYGLKFSWWLKDQPVDFSGVTEIFVKVCW